MVENKIKSNKEYDSILNIIKDKIEFSQYKAGIKVNEALLELYWEIGNTILNQIDNKGWGSKIIDKLSTDLKKLSPDNLGFSVRNLNYMKQFAKFYPDFPILQVPLAQNQNQIVQVPLAQITWYHHITLMTKVKDEMQRAFYIQETIDNGWSRNEMLLQIKSQLHKRSYKSINNFEATLDKHQSGLAKNIIKDPYNFEFLRIDSQLKEYELEKKLIEQISDFLLELGKGFAFVGRQYGIEVDGKDYKIDLLFYHTQLHCYVVIELKAGDFKPEYISKLNFYTNVVDDTIKTEVDNPTIGLLLCAEKSNVTVEYSIRGLEKPLGVAQYELEKVVQESIKMLNKK